MLIKIYKNAYFLKNHSPNRIQNQETIHEQLLLLYQPQYINLFSFKKNLQKNTIQSNKIKKNSAKHQSKTDMRIP